MINILTNVQQKRGLYKFYKHCFYIPKYVFEFYKTTKKLNRAFNLLHFIQLKSSIEKIIFKSLNAYPCFWLLILFLL